MNFYTLLSKLTLLISQKKKKASFGPILFFVEVRNLYKNLYLLHFYQPLKFIALSTLIYQLNRYIFI